MLLAVAVGIVSAFASGPAGLIALGTWVDYGLSPDQDGVVWHVVQP